MNYCIYKLKFLAPLHCGQGDGSVSLTNTSLTLRADTVFSALCNEANRACGGDGVEKIINLCESDKILFSDLFPYRGEELYIPKPIYPLDDGLTFDVKNRKAIKSVAWLPAKAESINAFSEYIHKGIMFETKDFAKDFAIMKIHKKASIRNGTDDISPYRVGVCEFKDNCGLYGILGYEDDSDKDYICKLFSVMSYSGIGGMISSGCGRFSFEIVDKHNECAEFLSSKINTNAENHMLLTTSLPKENEIENTLKDSYYTIVRRGGFSFSPSATAMVKKKTQYFIGSGSVLKSKFEGAVYTVGNNDKHNIYRYSKPMFMEVTI